MGLGCWLFLIEAMNKGMGTFAYLDISGSRSRRRRRGPRPLVSTRYLPPTPETLRSPGGTHIARESPRRLSPETRRPAACDGSRSTRAPPRFRSPYEAGRCWNRRRNLVCSFDPKSPWCTSPRTESCTCIDKVG